MPQGLPVNPRGLDSIGAWGQTATLDGALGRFTRQEPTEGYTKGSHVSNLPRTDSASALVRGSPTPSTLQSVRGHPVYPVRVTSGTAARHRLRLPVPGPALTPADR